LLDLFCLFRVPKAVARSTLESNAGDAQRLRASFGRRHHGTICRDRQLLWSNLPTTQCKCRAQLSRQLDCSRPCSKMNRETHLFQAFDAYRAHGPSVQVCHWHPSTGSRRSTLTHPELRRKPLAWGLTLSERLKRMRQHYGCLLLPCRCGASARRERTKRQRGNGFFDSMAKPHVVLARLCQSNLLVRKEITMGELHYPHSPGQGVAWLKRTAP